MKSEREKRKQKTYDNNYLMVKVLQRMMETDRLLIRPLMEEDCASFTGGIADASLRAAYGFRPDMDGRTAAEVFRHFCNLEKAYSLIEKKAGSMIGFLLDVDPELPEEISDGLPEKGHTLAYAVFPPWQRHGYMQEALTAYISYIFREKDAGYIHCGHFSDNEPGAALLRKLHFRRYASHMFSGRIITDEILFPHR